ncbi:ATP-binding cassette domain-containing protein, partial [Geobacillus sp. G4]
MAEAVLQVENLSASYRKNTVLFDVNFVVQAGSLVGIVGPNGAGKS